MPVISLDRLATDPEVAVFVAVDAGDWVGMAGFLRAPRFELTGETMPLPRAESQLAVFLARPVV